MTSGWPQYIYYSTVDVHSHHIQHALFMTVLVNWLSRCVNTAYLSLVIKTGSSTYYINLQRQRVQNENVERIYLHNAQNQTQTPFTFLVSMENMRPINTMSSLWWLTQICCEGGGNVQRDGEQQVCVGQVETHLVSLAVRHQHGLLCCSMPTIFCNDFFTLQSHRILKRSKYHYLELRTARQSLQRFQCYYFEMDSVSISRMWITFETRWWEFKSSQLLNKYVTQNAQM